MGKKENQQLAEEIDELKKELQDLTELMEEEELAEEIEEKIEELAERIKEKEFSIFLAGKYDQGNAILSIYAGAGGRDSQDWVSMLLRMYQRYCQRRGYKVNILDQHFGEGGGPEGRIGTKQVSLEIKGKFAYGFLKRETGVHRLVRISPFSPKPLRHTSFALVEVLPDLSQAQEKEIEIKPEEIKLETFRASGPGGQYVNRRETAVRITHLPTGIKVACQSERLQGQNRQKAMKILKVKLYQLKTTKIKRELKEIKGKRMVPAWGNQIRSYVLHPYKMVKDLRTKVQTSQVDEVLDGDLDRFIIAELRGD